ncbi:MAG TPA: phage tail protein [Blastocatellia bacterium]|nr:phage tail protein [Blastocatellia bacterium]
MASLGLNAGFSLVTNLLGMRADPYQAFNFLIEIEGIMAGGFSECSGLQVETEFQEYREGGVNDYVHRFPGPTKHPPLTLKHGLTQIDGLWRWHQEVSEGVSQGKEITRQNGTIYLLSKNGLPVMWWDFKEALPVKWTGPELRADSASVAFESVELVHRGLSRPSLANIVAGAGAELAGSFGL